MELVRKKTVKVKAPRAKKILNLAEFDKKKLNVPKLVIGLVVILAAAFALGKYGVADRFEALDQARSEAAALQAQIDSNYEQIKSLDGVSDEYAHYTYSGMTEDEMALVSRADVMDMIKRLITPNATVNTWTLQGNTLRMNLSKTTLAKVNKIVAAMDQEAIVNYSFVQTAATDSSVEITSRTEEITAQITVYLQIPDSAGEEVSE